MPDDTIDMDILPVFIAEGRELLPRISMLLRHLGDIPAPPGGAQELRRILHTIKGSARMVGAMSLGQMFHEMESQMQHAGSVFTESVLQQLIETYDQAVLHFEALCLPGEQQQLPETPAKPAKIIQPVKEIPVADTPLPTIRIDATILDDILNQAGEISIARSRLESRMEEFAGISQEILKHIRQLRTHLRDAEIQADLQMHETLSRTEEEGLFDPLEMDRFSHLHELMQMMKESASDIDMLYRGALGVTVDIAHQLEQQRTFTRDLQHDLMQARMVPFSDIEERLHRVVRQVAREERKQARLIVKGGDTAMDRNVLEKMTEIYGHILSNAIVHGIETPAVRKKAGKLAAGQLRISITHDSHEIVMQFEDDGMGIDLKRVAQHAIQAGMFEKDYLPTEEELLECLFEPGFSMAEELTQRAGRGVGMDVVRNTINTLGGYMHIETRMGYGVKLVAHLPVTLALSRVLLITVSGITFAVPVSLVEKVVRLSELDMASLEQGKVELNGERVLLDDMYRLLGLEAGEVTPQLGLLIRSETQPRLIRVDGVMGNREVVLKKIGPQLVQVKGLVGATILGAGDIVMIINPLMLAQRERTVGGMHSKTSHMSQHEQQAAVMIVDDSPTVRRVMQGILLREGYDVVQASDGMDALLQMASGLPAIMLVDLEMPRMDGFELIRKVRALSATMPIIVITTRTAGKHRKKALSLGANVCFGKPFQEAELLETIRRLLAQ